MEVRCLYDKLVDIKDLMAHPLNRNKHPKEQIERLAKILKYQGFRYPVKVSKRSGYITSGHGRILAAKYNKWKQVPVNFQDYESEEQEYADVQADNAIASWAELSLDEIKMDLNDLPDLDIDLLGIEGLDLSEPKEGLTDEDEVPEVEKNKFGVIEGQIWQLGEHRLMCGDSTNKTHVELLMNGEDVDLLLTDPPYGMNVVKPDGNIEGVRVGKNGYGKKGQYDKKAKCGVYSPIIGDDKPFDPSFLLNIGERQIIFGANHFSSKLPDSPHWIVWYKDMPNGTDFSGAELAWTSIEKKAVKTYKFTWAGMTRQGNRKDELSKRVHPTQKPVGLFELILNDLEYKNIIDLFLGSGSTLIACEKLNRKCFGMELDPHYCSVIIERWQNFTGQTAKLLDIS